MTFSHVWFNPNADRARCDASQLRVASSSSPLSPSPTMKSFAALLALVSIVAAVPAAYNEQIPLGKQATYPGFSLDLNARRLVQMDGQEPIWMTELEKVASYCFA